MQGVRLWAAPDSTRVVFDVSGPAEHRLFSLKSPDRLVVALRNAVIVDAVKNSLTDRAVEKAYREYTDSLKRSPVDSELLKAKLEETMRSRYQYHLDKAAQFVEKEL